MNIYQLVRNKGTHFIRAAVIAINDEVAIQLIEANDPHNGWLDAKISRFGNTNCRIQHVLSIEER